MSEHHNEAPPPMDTEAGPMDLSDDEPIENPITQGEAPRNDTVMLEDEEVPMYPRYLD